MYKIIFKYTSKARASRFYKGLVSIYDNLINTDDFCVICTFDENDSAYANKQFTDRLDAYRNLSYHFGVSTGKVNAINRDLDKLPPFDILVNFSDDQIFTVKGFDNIIRKAFEDSPNGLDTFIHFHDGKQNRTPTMSIMGRDYFLRTNYIYHPEYISLWCDNAAHAVALLLKRYKYMGDAVRIMSHEHPFNGRPELMDEMYKSSESFYKKDEVTFARHKKNNFFIKR